MLLTIVFKRVLEKIQEPRYKYKALPLMMTGTLSYHGIAHSVLRASPAEPGSQWRVNFDKICLNVAFRRFLDECDLKN